MKTVAERLVALTTQSGTVAEKRDANDQLAYADRMCRGRYDEPGTAATRLPTKPPATFHPRKAPPPPAPPAFATGHAKLQAMANVVTGALAPFSNPPPEIRPRSKR